MLRAVMYHYVRDLPRTRFSRIKGMLTADFARQVARLAEQFEMASLAAALAYLNGEYQPRRDLCLLTFDDGLKEHFTDVTPILAERRIQGLFFLITSCVDEHRVAHVHKNHFLMAWLDFGAYRDGFLEHLRRADPGFDTTVDPALAAKTYRWDEPDVAAFKYLLNFRLPEPLKAKILDAVFAAHLGDEAEFSRKLYVGWEEALNAGGRDACGRPFACPQRAGDIIRFRAIGRFANVPRSIDRERVGPTALAIQLSLWQAEFVHSAHDRLPARAGVRVRLRHRSRRQSTGPRDLRNPPDRSERYKYIRAVASAIFARCPRLFFTSFASSW